MIKKFISYYKPYKKLFILDLIVATIATICSLIYPMMTRVLINETIPNKEIKVIGIFAIILMLLYLIKAWTGMGRKLIFLDFIINIFIL